ncbi:unnamed protein product [Lymnaea stagnalis]|uniref:Methyltransferase type 11 domain-containing protein n=1 Tax=Lymnaea stagnalis TaxID=6523 RepID=A0AAV2I1D5_LYMST
MKKVFASLHNLERKVLIFPNTASNYIKIPTGIKVCKSLNDFKIKSIRGGFHRRPELIANLNVVRRPDFRTNLANFCSQTKGLSQGRSESTHRIQHELVLMAFKLNDSFRSTESEILDSLDVSNMKPKVILDIGCGEGASIIPILNMGHTCFGVDLNLQSLSEFKTLCLSGSYRIVKEPDFIHNNSNVFRSKECSLPLRCDKCSDHYRRELETSSTRNPEDDNNAFTSIDNYRSTCENNCRFQNVVTHTTPAADVVRWDLRYGLPFKPNSFDMAISISFLQWLFHGKAEQQLNKFFSSLRNVLLPGGRAIIQFYPSSASQVDNAIQVAMKYFQGVLIGDYPHLDRGRKLFMVLF